MATVAEHVPFSNLSKLCQTISDRKGKEKKKKPLEEFIEYWRSFHKELHKNNVSTTDTFFSAMRLLLPQCERQRTAYGIKEFTLAKLIIEIFCMDKNGSDAQKLINYRSPKTANAEAGDFASVAYFILKNRSPAKGTLKVHDINHYLDNIANNHGNKNKDDLKQDLLHLFRNMSALEAKWLIRMILKDMKLGISENTVFYVFHPDARDLFNVSNSLEKVCASLMDPSVRLHEIEISLFSPFRPMLSEVALPNQIESLMKGNPFIIETKYDGERLQLHKDGSSYMYFSRGGFDCTETYGGSPLRGNLTPHIHKSFKPEMSKCILDGEIVIYSKKLDCIVFKGENADIQALVPDGDYAPCFCVFDIVMFNGKILTNFPVSERVEFIRDTFTEINGKIQYTEQIFATSNEKVTEELNKAIDNRLEGIVIKNPASVYKPNIRKGGGWFKVKPEYIENLMDELDLIIIGGYFGEGRNSSIIASFLLAVASSEQTNDGPKCFYSICKIGSGYTQKELYELAGKLNDHWQPYNVKKFPSYLRIAGGRKEQPDIWIEPSKSVIVQVKATEIVRSNGFATECTLRFPRVEKIRYDKSWRDCMTVTELDDLKKLAQGRLATRSTTTADEEPSPKKQRIQNEIQKTIAPHYRPTDISQVQKESQLFAGKEFCVIVSSLNIKQDLEKAITKHGGKFVQNPGHGTFCILCDKLNAKARNMMNRGSYDVVKSDWIYNCIGKQSFLSWLPDDLFHATEKTQELLNQDFDKYGDSFIEDVTEESLHKIFKKISDQDWEENEASQEDICELEEKYFPSVSCYGLFRKCWIYISSEKNNNVSEAGMDTQHQLLNLKLKFYGANICDAIDDKTTHIIVLSNDEFQQSSQNSDVHVVSENWVVACINEGKLVDEEFYKVEENDSPPIESSGDLFPF